MKIFTLKAFSHFFAAVLLFTFYFSLSTAVAQESVNTTGGEANGSGGMVSYSVGQVVYTTNTGTDGSVAHGVQQPYEISAVTGIEEAKGINLTVSAYPNPTRDLLTLKVENYKSETLFYRIFDLSGKLLEVSRLTNYETQIAMSKYPPALYLLKVYDSQKVIKVFKIIKN
ncbi:MAG: T9SS type A sorting domain-containing protein [Bacteroidales bacterium]|nr:T9SS type A sorting domain-containing protein [Bacteroidales bacterium]MDD4671353.1 T9SS type A sorting domain-containing protein [Bacteroidales bacterium]MDY0349257.1 T9SS type A sorting domain-containing protein [Tenuifilaceae bacterium]